VVISSPFPQGDEGSIPIMAELNKGEREERGVRAREKEKRSFEYDLFSFFLALNLNMIFCKKIKLLAIYRLEVKSNITMVSKLTKKLKDEDKI
jgi:hypothetical protein